MTEVTFRCRIDAPVEEVFAWHQRPGALERLLPPWDATEVVEHQGGIEDGAQVVLRVKQGPFAMRWHALHQDYIPNQQFRDIQTKGPFSRWEHTHRFLPDGDVGCILEDSIQYDLPMGGLGKLVAGGSIQRMLETMFAFRHRRTQQDIGRHMQYRHVGPKRILISGASGLVGRNLTAFLTTGGHEVSHLVRRPPTRGQAEFFWDPKRQEIDRAALEWADIVVHLAGENIGAGRWNAKRKQSILESRIQTTGLLAQSILSCYSPPEAFISASAIGYYGDRKDDIITEDSSPGTNFVADVCQQWEAAAQPLRESKTRLAHLRIGVVLSAQDGALARMKTPFQMGAGGKIGSGKQGMSWIALDDLLGVIQAAMFDPQYQGPINATAPRPVSNLEFVRTLGRVLKRPTIAPLPAFVVKTMFGQMGQELLLDGAYVHPKRLQGYGFQFLYPTLEEALRFELGKLS